MTNSPISRMRADQAAFELRQDAFLASSAAFARHCRAGSLSSVCLVDTGVQHGPFLMDMDADEPIPARLDSCYQSRSVLLLGVHQSDVPDELGRPLLATVRTVTGETWTRPFAWLAFDRAPLAGLRRIPGSLRHA